MPGQTSLTRIWLPIEQTIIKRFHPMAEPNPLRFAIFFLLAFLHSGQAFAASLHEVYKLARLNDPVYLAARANFAADEEIQSQAVALLLPEISASGDVTRQRDETTTNLGEATEATTDNSYNSSYYEFTLKQAIFNAESLAAFSQARATVRKATAELAAAEQSLIKRSAEKYFGLLLAEINLELSKSEKLAIKKQLELAEARLAAGLAAITEVHEARARFQLADANDIEQQNKLEDARAALSELTGREIVSIKGLDEKHQLLLPVRNTSDYWIKQAEDQNFSILAKQAEADIAREQISRMRAGHYPSLDLVGSASNGESDGQAVGSTLSPDSDTRTRRNSIGLQLKVPLIQGGLVMAQTAEAGKRYEAAQHLLESTRRQVKRQARSAYLSVSNGSRRVRALNQSVIASESVVEAKQEGFKAGINTNLDVLDAQSELYLAKRDYENARFNYILNLFALKEAAGNLTEKDIEQVNTWLN
jgi:outer membrane protein